MNGPVPIARRALAPWLGVLLICALSPTAGADTLTLSADEDASVASTGGFMNGGLMLVGWPTYFEGPLETRAMVHFTLPTWLGERQIERATFRLYRTGTTGNPPTAILAFPATQAWSEQWPIFELGRGAELFYHANPIWQWKDWMSWGATELVRSVWLADTAANHGILVVPEGSPTAGYRAFAAREHGDPQLRPRLEIEYRYGIPPSIVRQPSDVIAAAEDSASFSLDVTGDEPLSVEWWHEGLPLAENPRGDFWRVGPSMFVCGIANLQAGDGGRYWAVVRNKWGAKISEVVNLTVESRRDSPEQLWRADIRVPAELHRFDPPLVVHDPSGATVMAVSFQPSLPGLQQPATLKPGLVLARLDPRGVPADGISDWK